MALRCTDAEDELERQLERACRRVLRAGGHGRETGWVGIVSAWVYFPRSRTYSDLECVSNLCEDFCLLKVPPRVHDFCVCVARLI